MASPNSEKKAPLALREERIFRDLVRRALSFFKRKEILEDPEYDLIDFTLALEEGCFDEARQIRSRLSCSRLTGSDYQGVVQGVIWEELLKEDGKEIEIIQRFGRPLDLDPLKVGDAVSFHLSQGRIGRAVQIIDKLGQPLYLKKEVEKYREFILAHFLDFAPVTPRLFLVEWVKVMNPYLDLKKEFAAALEVRLGQLFQKSSSSESLPLKRNFTGSIVEILLDLSQRVGLDSKAIYKVLQPFEKTIKATLQQAFLGEKLPFPLSSDPHSRTDSLEQGVKLMNTFGPYLELSDLEAGIIKQEQAIVTALGKSMEAERKIQSYRILVQERQEISKLEEGTKRLNEKERFQRQQYINKKRADLNDWAHREKIQTPEQLAAFPSHLLRVCGSYLDLTGELERGSVSLEPYASLFKDLSLRFGEETAKKKFQEFLLAELKNPQAPWPEPFLHLRPQPAENRK